MFLSLTYTVQIEACQCDISITYMDSLKSKELGADCSGWPWFWSHTPCWPKRRDDSGTGRYGAGPWAEVQASSGFVSVQQSPGKAKLRS